MIIHHSLFKQPTEKPTVGKSSAAKEPTDPPSKTEDHAELKTGDEQHGGVSAGKDVDPTKKGNWLHV